MPHPSSIVVSELPKPIARFCWVDDSPPKDMSACLFRQEFDLSSVPPSLRVFISADSRYKLWLNGELVGRGPLKGTPTHYHAETYELAPHLKKGKNVLAAEVRWFGKYGPECEVHTQEAGLYVQGVQSDALNTPGNWKAFADASLQANLEDPYEEARGWLGWLDRIDSRATPQHWRHTDFDASDWTQAIAIGEIPIRDGYGIQPAHCLTPSDIPLLSESPQTFARFLENRETVALPWSLESGKGGEIWLDAGKLTTSYPILEFEGGKDREVHIVYAEALGEWRNDQWKKQRPRNNIEAHEPHGYRDSLTLSGENHTFESFHWRTFWFIKIVILPGSEPVTLKCASHRFTTFPQSFSARFTCGTKDIDTLWNTSLHTLQLCAHETYEDCPYFEQLNYTADTRLQALASYWLSGQSDLGKRSIRLYKNSLSSNGLTASREPSRHRQEIPAFSLHWIFMLGDYFQLNGSDAGAYIRENLSAVSSVLSYFRTRINQNGFVGAVDDWPWIDWMRDWDRGVPPAVKAGTGSTYLTALYAMALEVAIELFEQTGCADEANQWVSLRSGLIHSLRNDSWSPEKGYFIEGPGRASDPFTQHTQIMVVLANATTDEQNERLRNSILDDPHLAKCSLFHSYYLAKALLKLGNYKHFFSKLLSPWHQMIEDGFTTWAENETQTRSDCHAWSSWIVIEFLQNILGARPAKPGWREIEIAPQYQATRYANGEFPTPVGVVSIAWSRDADESLTFTAETPAGIPTTITLLDGSKEFFPNGGIIERAQSAYTETA